jgi:hypothetical protein
MACDFEGTILGFEIPIWLHKNLLNGFLK